MIGLELQIFTLALPGYNIQGCFARDSALPSRLLPDKEDFSKDTSEIQSKDSRS